LLTFSWLLAGAALAVAAAALTKARRAAKRLERLTESYWELRYEQSQLRARLNRVDPEESRPDHEPSPTGAGSTAFIPLSSLKR